MRRAEQEVRSPRSKSEKEKRLERKKKEASTLSHLAECPRGRKKAEQVMHGRRSRRRATSMNERRPTRREKPDG